MSRNCLQRDSACLGYLTSALEKMRLLNWCKYWLSSMEILPCIALISCECVATWMSLTALWHFKNSTPSTIHLKGLWQINLFLLRLHEKSESLIVHGWRRESVSVNLILQQLGSIASVATNVAPTCEFTESGLLAGECRSMIWLKSLVWSSLWYGHVLWYGNCCRKHR